ncbi:PDR/VanB family oxidoreductase [Rhodococcus sp. USK10]|uniref:PDR/VanB family oxidoreductase n=1 Tax=Rhodococcus sp. USK10 TaxID=2789739 RepID=UPI0021512D68|nr:PDR/VanB family oxidoreductase [Rhodococcus sp. USK10]
MLDLHHPDSDVLPAWEAGAHIDLILPNGLVRQYSLCSTPEDRRSWRVAVLREPDGRGGSTFIHDELPLGSTVRVRGPRNHFPLVPAPRYVFIAGGIGITPLIPMMTAASSAGADWQLIYGGRSLTSMAFVEQLVAEHGHRVAVHPQDTCGLLNLDALLGGPDGLPDGTLVYCCGPGPLIDAVEQRCTGLLHVERFAPGDAGEPVLHGSFEVQVASTGQTLTVSPDESVLEVLRCNGIGIDAACEEGTCGTCETRVLDGQIDHRDFVLTAAEREQNALMMVCVSRAACPRVILDL